MAYFRCTTGGSGKGNTLVVTCADDLAGATITCTNGTKTYTKTCPSTSPYEVTFYGLMAGTWTVSATVSGNTYTTTVVITDYEAELGGFSWRRWVDTASQLDSTDYASLSEVLADEEAVRELCLEHACVDYMAGITTANADVETIINTDLFAKWVNNSDYALDFLHANEIIVDYMDEADKYGYGEWCLMPQVPKMTANNAPYGGVIATNSMVSSHYAYLAFDGDDSTEAYPSSSSTEARLGFQFLKPVEINSFYIKMSASYTNVCVLSYSDDGVNWVDTNTSITLEAQGIATVDVDASYGEHSYWSIRFTSTTAHYHGVYTLQFYAYAPKGNVPVMASDTAPYGEVIGSAVYQSYYKWKAFQPMQIDGAFVTTIVSNAFIGYRFTNPVCVRKVMLSDWDDGASYKCSTVYHYKIQASNDGFVNDIHDLATGENEYQAGTLDGLREYTFDNDNYYLYYRYLMVDVFPSGKQKTAFVVSHLQFYGRELSVSVPTMTGNITPYGKAIVGSDDTANIQPWKAFDGDDSTNNSYSVAANHHATGYDFGSPVAVKAAMMRKAGWYEHYLQYSDDNITWTTCSDVINLNNTLTVANYWFNIDANAGSHRYWRVCENNSQQTGTGGFYTLQFYGLDYSEKEFEEGTTKKWLYDHGVELEPVTLRKGSASGNSVTKENQRIHLKNGTTNQSAATYSAALWNIDFTDYSLIRVKFDANLQIGDSSHQACGLYISNSDSVRPQDGSYSDNYIAHVLTNNGSAILPYNLSLGCASVNQSAWLLVSETFYANYECTFNELWLE